MTEPRVFADSDVAATEDLPADMEVDEVYKPAAFKLSIPDTFPEPVTLSELETQKPVQTCNSKLQSFPLQSFIDDSYRSLALHQRNPLHSFHHCQLLDIPKYAQD